MTKDNEQKNIVLFIWSVYGYHVFIYKKRRYFIDPEISTRAQRVDLPNSNITASQKKDMWSRATSEGISSSLAFSQMKFTDEKRVFAERCSSHPPGCPPVGFKVRQHHACLPAPLWDTHLSSSAVRLHLVLILLFYRDKWQRSPHHTLISHYLIHCFWQSVSWRPSMWLQLISDQTW